MAVAARHRKPGPNRSISSLSTPPFLNAKNRNDTEEEYDHCYVAVPFLRLSRVLISLQDFLASVLSSAPTKRDAKQYLKTFGRPAAGDAAKPNQALYRDPDTDPKGLGILRSIAFGKSILAVSESPQFIQGPRTEERSAVDGKLHVAVVKFRDPQSLDDTTLDAVAKTLAQLRTLGLPSIVVVDTGHGAASRDDWLSQQNSQVSRIARAVDRYGAPLTVVLESALAVSDKLEGASRPFSADQLRVEEGDVLLRALEDGAVVVVPPCAISVGSNTMSPVRPNDAVLALTRYLSGLQFSTRAGTRSGSESTADKGAPVASVDRVIIVDPLGGTPASHRPNGAHVFLNMEEEFSTATADIGALTAVGLLDPEQQRDGSRAIEGIKQTHRDNLELARDALALLPSTSSVLLTSPMEVADAYSAGRDSPEEPIPLGRIGGVGTRRPQNPLIHNLLTDRPVHSPSLPPTKTASRTTLAKKGMPVTIYPDPRMQPWVPPKPGEHRLQLTDTCIDLPRLVHLINDSFNRKLDVQHYLDRVKDNLAGIIIAGEYEGGAILTWERPQGMDEETAYTSGRMVPYLDKFAVLKKSQGAGGVADLVFNAMVRDCFPRGVCWRSRKDNPVNKWYFERSRGTWKLDDTNWTMFWTTPWSASGKERVLDYEDVCRGVVPSWADNKQVAD